MGVALQTDCDGSPAVFAGAPDGHLDDMKLNEDARSPFYREVLTQASIVMLAGGVSRVKTGKSQPG